MTAPPAPPAERLRLFVAVELPVAWKEALARQASSLEAAAPGYARWVDSGLIHLTLAFLDGQPGEALPSIQAALDRAAEACRPLTLSLGPLGCFGGPRTVRVIWVGVQDSPAGALGQLRETVVGSLRTAGIIFEAGSFSAHVTLGRARREGSPRQSEAIYRAITGPHPGAAEKQPVILSEVNDPRPGGTDSSPHGLRMTAASRAPTEGVRAFACREITLFRSDLRQTGPIYRPLHRARLAPGRRTARRGAGSRGA